MKTIKHDTEYNEAIEQAITDFNTRGFDFAKEGDKKYIPSSNLHDVYIITMWSLYWTGSKPYALHKSRGHSWVIDIKYHPIMRAEVTDHRDHRDGIKTTDINRTLSIAA